MRVIVVASYAPSNIKEIINIKQTDFVIAVDGGFDILIKQKIKIDLVIGDMDSVKNKKKLTQYEKISLNVEKDFTDTYVAVEYAYTLSNKVYLIGGIQGNRIEHFIANTNMLNDFPELMILDNNSKIYLLGKGKHLINKGGQVSFFNFNDPIITLEGFKYNLNEYKLNRFDSLCISNEVIKVYGEITILEGRVLVVETTI